MSINDLKERMRDVPGIDGLTMRLVMGRQAFGFDGLIVATDPLATDEEIETAIRDAVAHRNETLPVPSANLIPAVNLTEAKPMSITGARYLAGSIKERIDAAKARVAAVGDNIDAGVSKLNSVADQGDQLAKTIHAEADALAAELGQFTNGAPE